MKRLLSGFIAALFLMSAASCAAVNQADSTILSSDDTVSLNAEEEAITIIASDAAYIRSGSHQNTNFKDTEFYFIKNDGESTTRHVIVKYDISSLTEPIGGSASAVINFYSVSPIHPDNPATEIKLKAYKESSSWSSDTVTFSSLAPVSESNYIAQNDLIKNDLAAFLNIELLDIDDVLLEYLVLLSAGFNYCKHEKHLSFL